MAGTQYMARLHLRALRRAGAEVVAVASPNTAAEFATRHGITAHYKDYRSMLEDTPLDAVVIATPNDLHYDVCLAAADAGRHVFCEKPLALSLGEADAMIAACEQAGVVLMYAENLLFAPMIERVCGPAAREEMGAPFLVKHVQGHGGPYSEWFWDIDRAGGGALMDMGPHSIHSVCHAMGAWPEAVTATLGRYLHGEKTLGEDHATILLHFPGGRLGVAEASWAMPGGAGSLVAHGPGGQLTASLLQGPALEAFHAPGTVRGGERGNRVHVPVDSSRQWGYDEQARHFVAVISGREELRSGGADGRRVLEIICAAYESARLGRRVPLPFASDREKAIDHWLDEESGEWSEWD
ncbi:MAG: gfo/Idh/MocA family oxidoreductase [Chloroflexi bacterium CFX7]|nr:gfo/Idh/MocA family oxidoreductase [Chloroflexi bacterium CFX7]